VFVIDACRSDMRYTLANFIRIKEFVKRIIGFLYVKRRFVRISIVIYANQARIVVPVNSNMSKQRIYREINKMKLICGVRYTAKSIRYTYTNIFRYSRRYRVLVLITTGASRDRVTRSSLRLSGIESFAIGVGRHYRFSELLQIATDRHHVYNVGFRNIESLHLIFRKKLCKKRKYTKHVFFSSS